MCPAGHTVMCFSKAGNSYSLTERMNPMIFKKKPEEACTLIVSLAVKVNTVVGY